MIDKLITIAPDTPPPEFDVAYRKLWERYDLKEYAQAQAKLFKPYHAAPKVTIGSYNILNNKTSLRAFKKALRRRITATPIRTPTPPTRPQNKRIVNFDGKYTKPYTPCKVHRLIERDSSWSTAGLYFDGFWSNTQYMVRISKPKTKRPLEVTQRVHHDFIVDALNGLAEASIGPETYMTGGVPMVNILGAHPIVINATYLDIIMKYHPGAQPWLKHDVVYFLAEGILVGVIMRMIQ